MDFFVNRCKKSSSKISNTLLVLRVFTVKFLMLVVLMMALPPNVVFADSIIAPNCAQSTVQQAIESSNAGDVIVIPSGECFWSSSVSIPDNKKITLLGAGFDKTSITVTGTAIFMNRSGARISGLGFILQSGDEIINVKGKGWRIDHCKFSNVTGDSKISIHANGRNVSEYPTGLVDNNVFINGRVLVNGLYTFEKMSGTWAEKLNLGSEDAVYIEDCQFTRTDGAVRNALDGNRGAKSVFRFNSINDTYLEAHSLQSDSERAFRKWEIYGNTLHSDSNQYLPIRIIGGTGVIFNNILSGDYNSRVIDFYNRRSYDSIGTAGLCNGSSLWDGNMDETGWPCRDQIGRSTDQWIFDKNNPPYPVQESAPAYLWLNRNPTSIANVITSNGSDQHIKSDRDFYNEVSSFNGTSGVGVGTYSNRPSTCTPGVAYWATDRGSWNKSGSGGQGVLYKCVSKDQWELYYTPYTYPHPMRAADSVVNIPEPPRELGPIG